MLSKGLVRSLGLAAAVLLVGSTGALGQVDWGELFPEEAKPAAKPAPAVVPPAPAAQAAERAPQRAKQVAKPASAAVHHAAPSKPARRVAAKSRPRSDSEFPAAADVAAPQFDRRSQRRSSPPPSTMEDAAATVATDEAQPAAAPVRASERVADKPAPVAPEPVVAAAEPEAQPEAAPAPAPARRNKVEQPVAHESAPVAVAETEPAPAPQPAAPAAAARVARAAAAQPARPPVAEAVAPRAEAPAAEAPVQIAAASAESVMAADGRHASAPASGADLMAAASLHPGDVISDKNMDKYSELLSPGLEWAIRYGLRMKIVAPRHIDLPRPYREATEKYAGQVKLSADGRRLDHYIAGQPFPNIDVNDPQVALKIMWNYSYSGYATDDSNAENFESNTGSVGKNKGMTVERHYLIDNLRRLNYTGRLYVDPKPNMPNTEDLRNKESLHPLSEPFDLKGVGGTFYRYNDPNRQDDSWLYLPQLRRVRRLSSAQRSDALFGQDTDPDSYYGYNGQIGWATWKFLGERTVPAIMHAENRPVKWQEPEDWLFDDVWEPRRVYVVEGESTLSQYAYGKRVIFIDKEGWIVTHSDIYDRAGQLWKLWINNHALRKESMPGASTYKYADEMAFTNAIVMIDTQLVHATAAAIPSRNSPSECVYLNLGAKSGTTEDFFTVANLIESGH